jgi:hypothetical protein
MRTNFRPERSRASRVAAFVVGTWTYALSAGHAFAGEPCHVVEDLDRSALVPAWRTAVEGLEREIAASLRTTCHGIELRLTEDEGRIRVSAVARDGRRTSRLVLVPAGLSAVAFGLLAMAPSEPEPPPDDPLDYPPPAEPSVVRPAPPAPFDQPLRVSVGASTGARGGFPTNVVMADAEVRADLFVHGWIVDVSMRAAPVSLSSRLPYDDDAYAEAAGGLGFGRELRWGRSTLDLTGGANFTYIWMENDGLNLAIEHAQLRLAAVARCGYALSRRLRVHVALDGELAPSGLVSPAFPTGLAPFPAFTLGLRVGAEVVL